MFLQISWRRLTIVAGLVGILGASLSGCGGGGSSSSGGGGGGSRAACAPNTHQSGRPRWTVLVYMNAANDLQPDSLLNVGQMASVGSDGTNLNIVLQWKQANCPTNPNGCGNPSFIGTRRYLIRPHSSSDVAQIKNGNTAVLDPDRLPDPSTNDSSGQSDMGNWHVLNNFLQWGAQTYPADNLALVIWDHGSGWVDVYRRPSKKGAPPKPRAVSVDYSTSDEIETWELPQGLASPQQPIDMLIIDCSLEQMLEVAYQVRSNARVLVGSEDSPPGPGYPYDKWLSYVKASGQNPCDVGNTLVQDFIASYNSSQWPDLTNSVLDLSKMQGVANAQEALAQSLNRHIADQSAAYVYARTNAWSYDNPYYADNKDLFNYVDLLRQKATASDLQQAAVGVEASLTGSGGAILYNVHGSNQPNSNGLAVYVPAPGSYISTYANLALSQAGGAPDWAKFLQSQTQ
ncbi:MAG TPA: clostripain-related cysteine peptidase [Chthonomonadaceae bacterium]|nr:clostripain-related cysteine peptidase [Chthonomonadaceae bacterium]